MRSRDAALAAVHDRLARAATDQDPSGVLTGEAVREAEALAAVTDPANDLDAAYVLGTFHWFRYLARPGGADQDDLTDAVRLLAPVFQVDPGAVPEPLHRFYQEARGRGGASQPDPGTAMGRAMESLADYQRTRRVPLLTEAVALFRAAAADDHANSATIMCSLAIALQEWSEESGDTVALAEAVRALRDALAALSADNPDRAVVLCNVGVAFQQCFKLNGDVSMMGEAAQALRAAVAALPIAHPDRAVVLNNLAGALRGWAAHTGDITVREEAVQVLRDAVAALPLGHPDRATFLSNLGGALQEVSESTGDAIALTEAVQADRDAVAASLPGDPDRAQHLSHLGAALWLLFERTGDTALLTEAVQVSRDAAAAIPSGYPDRAAVLINLGNALDALFERTGRPEVLAEAIQATRDAVAATPAIDPDRGRPLHNLGKSLRESFENSGNFAQLEEAVRAGRAAVAATPAGHPERARYLNSLSHSLDTWFRRTGDISVLEEAIQTSRDAVATTPAGHPDHANNLNNLSSALELLFENTGDITVLTEAIQVARDTVAAAPTSHAARARYLANLSSYLRQLSERTGDSAALAEAVQAARDMMAATPADHPDRAGHLHTLGHALQALYERTGDSAVSAEAVQVARDAVAALPVGHPRRTLLLDSLAGKLYVLSRRTGDNAVLAEAVQAARDAVAATPADHPDRARHLNTLGITLQARSENPEDPDVLAEAIQCLRDSVTAAPADHPSRAGHLYNLGNAFLELSERTGDTAAVAAAASCFTQAADNAGARAAVRILAYCAVAELAGRGGVSPQDALAAVEAAVGLLPQVAARALIRADREYSLGQQASLAGRAAAVAVAAGQAGRAVELLEQTRGVLVADSLDARSSDLSRLRGQSPALADEFDRLRVRIDTLDDPDPVLERADTPGRGLSSPRARQDAYAAWDDLITRIREISGFESFLRPPGIRQLAAQVGADPVVFVYTSQVRCDALILTDDPGSPVRVVPLAELAEEDAYRQAIRLLTAQRAAADPDNDPADRIAAQAEILDVLTWIWDTIAGPVLAALGRTATPDDQAWPRVWWCPVGILAYLPLHAAGHYHDSADRPHPRTVLDLVISSYITTVRGLAYARRQHADSGQALIVAVPDAPGASPLPGAAAEAGALAELIPGAHVLPHPTCSTVLDALPRHPAAHFACHGYADWANPAASQLILYDHDTTPLTVADISARHLTGALAYLSACETAVTSLALANEAVHITGAFHLAGYQHVIGTLWPINDATARDLACDIYSHLTHDGTTLPDTGRAPHALHHATRRLRDRYPRTPSLWAGHTHTGT